MQRGKNHASDRLEKGGGVAPPLPRGSANVLSWRCLSQSVSVRVSLCLSVCLSAQKWEKLLSNINAILKERVLSVNLICEYILVIFDLTFDTKSYLLFYKEATCIETTEYV